MAKGIFSTTVIKKIAGICDVCGLDYYRDVLTGILNDKDLPEDVDDVKDWIDAQVRQSAAVALSTVAIHYHDALLYDHGISDTVKRLAKDILFLSRYVYSE